MSTRSLLLWTVTLAASAAVLALAAHQDSRARAAAQRVIAQHTRVRDQTRELLLLRERARSASAKPGGQAAGSGLTQRVTAALTQAHLPPSSLASLSPEAPSLLPEQPGLKRQRATLALSGLTLPQVGGFLEAWRRAEPAWTITRIDLSPQGGSAPAAGGDLPLRTGLTLEALIPDDPKPGAQP